MNYFAWGNASPSYVIPSLSLPLYFLSPLACDKPNGSFPSPSPTIKFSSPTPKKTTCCYQARANLQMIPSLSLSLLSSCMRACARACVCYPRLLCFVDSNRSLGLVCRLHRFRFRRFAWRNLSVDPGEKNRISLRQVF